MKLCFVMRLVDIAKKQLTIMVNNTIHHENALMFNAERLAKYNRC